MRLSGLECGLLRQRFFSLASGVNNAIVVIGGAHPVAKPIFSLSAVLDFGVAGSVISTSFMFAIAFACVRFSERHYNALTRDSR